MIQRLLSFLLDTSFEDLTPEIIFQAKRCMVDWIGVTLGGAESFVYLHSDPNHQGAWREKPSNNSRHTNKDLHASCSSGQWGHVSCFGF
jgi:hypothetical protein